MRLEWRQTAIEDRDRIMDYIAQDNPLAALELDEEIESKATSLVDHPKLYKQGRVKGIREMVVRPNYVVVYQETAEAIVILRVLHASQQWP